MSTMPIMKPTIFLLLLATIHFSFGCTQTPNRSPNPSATDSITVDDTTPRTPPKPEVLKVQVAEPSKIPSKSDPFGIPEAHVEGDFLKLGVEYGGGCKDHVFQVYWDGSYREEEPVSVALHIHHNANNDPCEAIVREELKVDLSPLKGDAGQGQEITLELVGHKKHIAYRF